MVVVMIVAFMVAWTPYATFAILVTIYPTIELDPRLASIPAFFSKTAAVYNPIIYVFMNKQVTLLLVLYAFVCKVERHKPQHNRSNTFLLFLPVLDVSLPVNNRWSREKKKCQI